VNRREPTDFERTCLPLLGDCRAFALSLTRSSHDADDLVQDTFLRAQDAFASFEPGTNARAWLFTILRRLHIDRFRRKRIRPASLPEEDLEERAMPRPAPPVEDLPWDSLPPGAVLKAVEAVPEPFRLPVRLRDLDGFSYREIGEVLGIPQGTVMSRLHRGREYVRQALVSLLKGNAPDPE
jgi:RNA polymerase sigma-70 factor (ECF subfamily)